MSQLSHRQHLKSLDGIRGIAILAVFCYHLYPASETDPLRRLFSLGWLGVDLFFVLSGFLITGILFDTQHQRGYLRNFYGRRALRLFPVYLLVVAGVLTVSHFLGGTVTRWTLPYFLYGSNIVRDLRLPIGVSGRIDVSPYWSLAVEEQFYLLWPFAVMVARTRRRVLWTCAVGAGVSVGLRWWAAGTPHFFLGTPYYELPMRLDSLLSGGALAIALRMRRGTGWLSPGLLRWVMAAGMMVVVGCAAVGRDAEPTSAAMVRFGYAGAAACFVSLVALALRPGTWAYRLGSVPVLRVFGRYSYGMYLIHFLGTPEYPASVGRVHGTHAVLDRLVRVAWFGEHLLLTLAIAALSYHLLELPILRLKRYFAYPDEQRAHVVQAEQETLVPVEGRR